MAGKEASVYVVDVNPRMGELRGDGKSGLDLIRETLHQLVSQKLIYPKQDEMGIVLVGSDGQQQQQYATGQSRTTTPGIPLTAPCPVDVVLDCRDVQRPQRSRPGHV